VFSLLALLLAAIGTYGVLAYDVTSRTHEIGLRMALGARHANVVRMVLRRALGVALPGVVVGSAGALALTRVLSTSLFELKPTDPSPSRPSRPSCSASRCWRLSCHPGALREWIHSSHCGTSDVGPDCARLTIPNRLGTEPPDLFVNQRPQAGGGRQLR